MGPGGAGRGEVVRRWLEGSLEPGSLRFVLTLAGIMGVLVVLGVGTAAVVSANRSPAAPVVRLGPKKNYAALPEMSFDLGGAGARTMDLRVLVELDPGLDPKAADPYGPRIADRLGDRIREIGPDRLGGAEGAQLVKGALALVLEREMRPLRARDILLDRMVIR